MAKQKKEEPKLESVSEDLLTNGNIVTKTEEPEEDEIVFTMDDSEEEEKEAPAPKKGPAPQRERTELEAACYTYLKSLSLHDFALHSKFSDAEALLKKF